jgi:hypothetical protein
MPYFSSGTWCSFGAGVLSLLGAGCSDDPYKLTEVTGTVTCNGKPAWGGFVVFEPVDASEKTGRPPGEPGGVSRGIVGEDGSFTLMMDPKGEYEQRDGALTGPHRVSFLPPRTEPAEFSPADEWMPAEEKERAKAELAAIPVFKPLDCGNAISPNEVEVVQGGENNFSFTLSGEPMRPQSTPVQGASD